MASKRSLPAIESRPSLPNLGSRDDASNGPFAIGVAVALCHRYRLLAYAQSYARSVSPALAIASS